MKLFRTVLMSGLALALCGGASEAPAAQAPAKMITLQMPATPDPARVTLDPKTTALIVLDYVEDIWGLSRRLLKLSGGSVDILRDVLH
jgi:hypothetical protein